MKNAILVSCVLLLTACGGGTTPEGLVTTPPATETVASVTVLDDTSEAGYIIRNLEIKTTVTTYAVTYANIDVKPGDVITQATSEEGSTLLYCNGELLDVLGYKSQTETITNMEEQS